MTELEFKENIYELMNNELIEVEHEVIKAKREGNTTKLHTLYEIRDNIIDTMLWYRENVIENKEYNAMENAINTDNQ